MPKGGKQLNCALDLPQLSGHAINVALKCDETRTLVYFECISIKVCHGGCGCEGKLIKKRFCAWCLATSLALRWPCSSSCFTHRNDEAGAASLPSCQLCLVILCAWCEKRHKSRASGQAKQQQPATTPKASWIPGVLSSVSEKHGLRRTGRAPTVVAPKCKMLQLHLGKRIIPLGGKGALSSCLQPRKAG